MTIAHRLLQVLPMALGVVAVTIGQILFARGAGPEVFGTYSLIFAWINSAVVLAVAGFQFSATKSIPPRLASSSNSELRYILKLIVSSVVILSVLTSSVLGLVAIANPFDLAPEMMSGLWPAYLLVPLLALGQIRIAVASALGRFWVAQLPDNIFRPLLLGCTVLALSLSENIVTAEQLIYITFTINLGVGLLGSFLIWGRLPLNDHAKFDLSALRKEVYSVAAYLGISNIFIGLAKNIDIALIGHLVSPVELGVYIVASRTAEIINIIYALVDPVYCPKFSQSSAIERRSNLAAEVASYKKITLAWSLLILICYLVAGQYILQVFGNEFQGGTLVLVVLACAFCINALSGPGSQLLTILGFEQDTLRITSLSLVVYLCLLPLLVLRFDTLGAAFAVLAYQLLRSAWLAQVVKKKIGIKILP